MFYMFHKMKQDRLANIIKEVAMKSVVSFDKSRENNGFYFVKDGPKGEERIYIQKEKLMVGGYCYRLLYRRLKLKSFNVGLDFFSEQELIKQDLSYLVVFDDEELFGKVEHDFLLTQKMFISSRIEECNDKLVNSEISLARLKDKEANILNNRNFVSQQSHAVKKLDEEKFISLEKLLLAESEEQLLRTQVQRKKETFLRDELNQELEELILKETELENRLISKK